MAAYKDEQRGTWYVSFHYYDWTGKNCRKVKRGFKTKREATEWEHHFRMKEAADLDMTFGEFVQAYTRDMKPKLKHNTWLTKEHILRTKLLPYFENKKMCDIRAKDIIQWQNEEGSGYKVRELGEVDRYSWENGNAVHYAYLPQKEITYEYNSQLRPENFPFRVVNSFQPVGFDVISPLNLLYGKMNQNLPTRAYWYNVSDATDICAEYTFRYTLTGDYITGMTIEEKINPVNGATAENNTYEYEFIYNFVVEQK